MRLVVLGLSLSSSWGNGHATTYRALLRPSRRAGTTSCSWSATCPGTRRTATCADPISADSRFYDDLADLERWRARSPRPTR